LLLLALATPPKVQQLCRNQLLFAAAAEERRRSDDAARQPVVPHPLDPSLSKPPKTKPKITFNNRGTTRQAAKEKQRTQFKMVLPPFRLL
jgi:hypothetical protein